MVVYPSEAGEMEPRPSAVEANMVSGIRGWENGCNITPHWFSSACGTHSGNAKRKRLGGMGVKRAETTQEKEKKEPERDDDERTVFSGSLFRENP